MRRFATTLLMTAALIIGTVTPLGAAGHTYPDVIPLPDGFFPEGIAVGHGNTFYAGSLSTGAIVQGDLRSGEVSILTTGAGAPAVGMDFDESSGHLFVAGGPLGTLAVFDTADGSTVAQLALPGGAFVNDVIVTGTTAYVTDSFISQFFAVSLDRKGVPTGDVAVVPLTGDWVEVPGDFNSNGIEATNKGDTLIIVNSSLGRLYAVDSASGLATAIDLGGGAVPNGDGIVLTGRTLYVVQNFDEQITEIRLAPDLSSGEITDTITSPAFDVPTTAAKFGNSLYAVNARFSTPPLPTTTYDVVRVDR